MPPNPAYHVVAMSMPIVYTREGDHDRNGLLFTLKAHEPLLRWARDRWEEHDEFLPRLHERRQRLQLVVDNLGLLNLIVPRLRKGSDADRALLAELVRREHVGGVPQPASDPDDEDEDGSGRDGRTPHDRAVRQNVLRVVDDLRFALGELANEDEPAGGIPEPDEPLVSLTDAERATLLKNWTVQRDQADAAVEAWLVELNKDPARKLDTADLKSKSGIPETRIRRLLLNDHSTPWSGSGAHPYDRFNPLLPIPLVRPLVLRARVGEPIRVRVENQIRGRRIGFHVQGAGLGGPQATQSGVRSGDGARIGLNNDSTIAFGATRIHRFDVPYEGVWPINDLADVRGIQVGSNVHGLFGALVVEPEDTTWRDPETGDDLTFKPWGDGLYVDVLEPDDPRDHKNDRFVDFYSDDIKRSFREFAVFMHDEPEIASGLHTEGEHSIMPLSYRAEPMPNRLPHRMRRLAERTPADPSPGQTGIDRRAVARRLGDEFDEQFFIGRRPDGTFVERVAGEEQHHSSWLFGEPETPVLRAYKGDPARIRLVHGGVKETHVFHLHVHQWRAVPQDTAPPSVWGRDPNGVLQHKGSQLLDSITIGPQTGFDIDPLYGSGSRQQSVGDIIWHCHLYPHFHHGMWGLWRSFDRRVDGTRAYPDGTPSFALVELPGRAPDPVEPGKPGFPWFIDGEYPQKSPPPPALLDAHVGGRRRLLGMGLHTQAERDAFHPAVVADPQPGVLFVDLDGLSRTANENVGLTAPHRVIHYDVEVLAANAEYNRQGWHDAAGHYYRLLRVQVREVDSSGAVVTTHPDVFPDLDEAPVPFYPRANHGDLVELTLFNSLGSFPADPFDLGQLPVECGLHVHLVKFDPLAADGSSTGWNYLSGASCPEAVGPNVPEQPARNTSFHRWVVDEEFGPCFFHDHLLANYRQKHGLFAALIAEPPGSQWHTADQEDTAWAGAEAVVVPPTNTGVPPFRDFCLAVGDFVPLLDRGGRPLNPPGELGGDDDPGSMAVNYKSAPLTFRGRDPSTWFTTQHDVPPGEPEEAEAPEEAEGAEEPEGPEPPRAAALPDTPTIRSHPGERMRIRLIQGSHEEQHSFVINGMRWPREWHNPASVLINQQTLGISEAFSLDIDPAARSRYGPGDHLWRFNNIDDTWLGCWGLWRVTLPGDPAFPPLPELTTPATAVPVRAVPDRPPASDPSVRTFVVVARRTEHRYARDVLTDPWGLIYHHAEYEATEHDAARHSGEWRPSTVHETGEPLVLRARRGEWVRVFLVNEVRRPDDEDPDLPRFGVEPSPPVLPLEHLDDLERPDRRTVTPRVSLHPSLLLHDVVSDDGSFVGVNRDGTVAALPGDDDDGHDEHGGEVVERDGHAFGHDRQNWTEYWWYVDEALAPDSATDGPGQVCLLEDLADVRNHRHHGLFGALVVEPPGVTPFRPGDLTEEAWWGTEAELRADGGDLAAYEAVLFVQDGLRLFVNGHPDQPVPDVVPGDDPEDSGQKGMSYRAVPIHRGRPPRGADPGTPILATRAGDRVWLRLVGAGDKPRNHSLNVHGVAMRPAPWVPNGWRLGAASGVSNGWVETVVVDSLQPGDHAVRTGVFRWGTEQGIWALLRGL